jgi:hypothetical protein
MTKDIQYRKDGSEIRLLPSEEPAHQRDGFAALAVEISRVYEERDRFASYAEGLKAALIKYGRHTPGCPAEDGYHHPLCNCGMNDAIGKRLEQSEIGDSDFIERVNLAVSCNGATAVADGLGVSVPTVSRWCQSKNLPHALVRSDIVRGLERLQRGDDSAAQRMKGVVAGFQKGRALTGNYVANAEQSPTRVLFENGRTVEIVDGQLEVGWAREEADATFHGDSRPRTGVKSDG